MTSPNRPSHESRAGVAALRAVPILAGLALLVIELTHLAEGKDAAVEFLLLGVALVALGCLPRRAFEHTIGKLVETVTGSDGGDVLNPSSAGGKEVADLHDQGTPTSSRHVQADMDVRLRAICAAIRSSDPGEQERGLDAGIAAWSELDAGARRQLVALAGDVKRPGGDADSRARRGARIVELEALAASG